MLHIIPCCLTSSKHVNLESTRKYPEIHLFFLYHYDDEAIVTASSMRSKLSVMEIFPDLCEKIPYVPVDQILAPLPSDSDTVPLSMEFNLVSVDTFKKFPGIPPNFDMEMLKSFYLTVMDDVDRVTPPQGVDEVTV